MNHSERIDLDDEAVRELGAEDFAAGVRGKLAGRMPPARITVEVECAWSAGRGWCARAMDFPQARACEATAELAIRHLERLVTALVAGRALRGEIAPTGLYFSISYPKGSDSAA